MGTGTIEFKKFKEQRTVNPDYRKKLNGFIEAITPGEPICKHHEKNKSQIRWMTLVNLYNIFSELMRGYGNLVNWEDKKVILERIGELKKEASFCNKEISDKEDLSHGIRSLAEKYIPKGDWERLRKEQQEEREGK